MERFEYTVTAEDEALGLNLGKLARQRLNAFIHLHQHRHQRT